MRLHRIGITNLNSLHGRHEIVLDGALGGAPQFLISGPTGAGKSTILDAVCLALFGETPRLVNRAGREDQHPAQAMSRGTGEAEAELEWSRLEDKQRQRYRTLWRVQRARKRPDGKVQPVIRGIERQRADGTWEVLAQSSTHKDYGPAFHRALDGLKVEDFKRCVMLAQGEFAAFLRASEDERAQILERLTDTGLYRRIGGAAAGRLSDARATLDQARQAMGLVSLLAPDDEARLRQELADLAEAMGVAELEQGRARDALLWWRREAELADVWGRAEADLKSAQEAQSAAAPEISRLTEHERCEPGAEPLREWERIRKEAEQAAARLPGLGESVSKLAGLVAEIGPRLGLAREDAARHQEALQAALPEIGLARSLRTRRDPARIALEEATTTRGGKQLAAEKAASSLQRAAAEVAVAVEAVAAAGEQDQRTERDERWLAEEGGLRIRAEELGRARTALAAAEGLCQKEEAALLTEQAAADGLKTQVATATAALDPARRVAEEARATLATALGGEPDPRSLRERLREEAARRGRQQNALTGAARLQGEGARLADRKKEVGLRREMELVTLQGLRAEAAGLDGQRRTVADEVRQCEEDLQLLRWVRRMVAERGNLQPGMECPLCGGTERPDLHLDHAEADRVAAARLSEREGQSKTLTAEAADQEKRALKLGKGIAGTEAVIAGQDREISDLTQAQTEAAVALAVELQGAKLPPDASGELVRGQMETLSAAEQAGTELGHRLDEAEQAAVKADEALRRAVTEAQALAGRLDSLRVRLDVQSAAVKRERTRIEEEQGAAAEREAEILAGLRAAGIEADALASALTIVKDRARARRDALAAVSAAGEARSKAELLREGAIGVDGLARAAWIGATEALESAQRVLDVLDAEIAEVFGGQDPDGLQTRLEQARDQANQVAADLDRSRLQAEKDLASGKSVQAQEEERAQALSLTTAGLWLDLEAALRELDLPTVEALTATRLDGPQFRGLTERRRILREAVARAEATLNAQQRALLAHRDCRPGEAPPECPEADLVTRLTDTQERFTTTREQHAARAADLRRQEDDRLRLGALESKRREAESEYGLWLRLHNLIGVKDGQGFQRFAQILNMEELAGKANHHLSRLSPRYSLVTARGSEGEPRLDFAVGDTFQAGENRPLTTLSGGETFLVSLALALALADYRAVKMPIETLLLDEGFGTLDQGTLQTAMSALQTLQLSGVQVGIISHVEALRELIPVKIIVERRGDGRAGVRVETG